MDIFSDESDLDLSVNFSSESVELPHEEKIIALERFSNKFYSLQNKGHVSGVNPILSARVPVLKVVDCGTGIECDISIDNRDGILKSQFVLIVSAIDERFQKLSSLMKAWAKAHDINSSKDRTLSSLAILLLVALHLQTREPPILPPFSVLLKDGSNPEDVKKVVQNYLQYGKENKESVAELFATLLFKLASVEDEWSKGLCASTYQGSWIYKTWEYPKSGIIGVEDFIDHSQNVAGVVRKAQAAVIYEVINSSLCHLSEFIAGRIQAPELRELLFGSPGRKRRFTVFDAVLAAPIEVLDADLASPSPVLDADLSPSPAIDADLAPSPVIDAKLSHCQGREKKVRQNSENSDTELSHYQERVKKTRRGRKRDRYATRKDKWMREKIESLEAEEARKKLQWVTWMREKIDSLDSEEARKKLQWVKDLLDDIQNPVFKPSEVSTSCPHDDRQRASLCNQILPCLSPGSPSPCPTNVGIQQLSFFDSQLWRGDSPPMSPTPKADL
ncbi:hypothetical protein ACHQM5_004071 [Ranunculus cassubicifolius]